jgi:hypothetical protein
VQAARSERWASNEQGGTAADGEKRAGEERNRSKAEARSHEAPLGEVRLSEQRLPSSQQSDWLRCPQAEEFSEMLWHPEELDADLPLGWRTHIASQTLGPREPKVRPLRPRKDRRRRRRAALAGQDRGIPHLDVLITHQRVEVQLESPGKPPLASSPMLSRPKRAHYRLDWHERFARNGRASGASQVTIKLFGVPQAFAPWLGLKVG